MYIYGNRPIRAKLFQNLSFEEYKLLRKFVEEKKKLLITGMRDIIRNEDGSFNVTLDLEAEGL